MMLPVGRVQWGQSCSIHVTAGWTCTTAAAAACSSSDPTLSRLHVRSANAPHASWVHQVLHCATYMWLYSHPGYSRCAALVMAACIPHSCKEQTNHLQSSQLALSCMPVSFKRRQVQAMLITVMRVSICAQHVIVNRCRVHGATAAACLMGPPPVDSSKLL